MRQTAYDALDERIIGQGKTVEKFEMLLSTLLRSPNILTINSGTSALELAYHLLDLKPGDEVITPVYTCTATNIPLVRRGVTIIFADIENNFLMNWDNVEKKITKKTKAIVNVHLFNQLNTNKDLGIPIIGDAAQYIGETEGERLTAYSFQATKILTTIDGGALVCKLKEDYNRAKLLRWYGIDRETGQNSIDMDITEAGYKYHMNNVTAAIGIAGLNDLKKLKSDILSLQKRYEKLLGVQGGSPFLIQTKNRKKLADRLAIQGIETGLVHKRNDIYSVFGGKRQNLPNMNRLESTYLFLPCHNHMTVTDVEFICSIVKKYI